MYQPLGKSSSSAFDYRSTFSFSTNSKPASSETRYSHINLDVLPGNQYMNPTQSNLSMVGVAFIKFCAVLCFVLTFPISAFFCLKMVHQYERLVVFRIGHLLPLKGPGMVIVFPCIDRWSRVDLRTKAFNVPPTRICTSDGGLILFGCVVHHRVQSPLLVKNSLQDMNHSVRVACQAAMSTVLSKKRFADLKANAVRYNYDIQIEINLAAVEWGLEIGRVELSQPTVEVNAPDHSNSGFFSKLMSGMSGGGGGGGNNAMGQLMNAMTMSAGQGTSQPAFQQPAQSSADQNSLSPATIESASQSLLDTIRSVLTTDLVSKVDAAFEIKLSDIGKSYYIDLKTGSGSCGEGGLPNNVPDATLTLTFKTLIDLLCGQIGALGAYTNGGLDVQGDVKTAMRLEEIAKALKV